MKDVGISPLTYMSPYFYISTNMGRFIEEVRRLRDTYGIEGVYYDGVPSQDWLAAYEVMRMTRETFPDGNIIVHTTGQGYNGGPPLGVADLMIPCVDTYATATLRGEYILFEEGADWNYPKYITSQYRIANCFGIQKPDRWRNMEEIESFLIALTYNGRGRMTGNREEYKEVYLKPLRELEQLWIEHGDEENFFEQYFKPAAEKILAEYRKNN
jgi:hypothetical protein